ncbi:hypothetical protein [Methanocaldococcus sp.]
MINIDIDSLDKFVKDVKCRCGYKFKAVGKKVICPKCKSLVYIDDKDKS